MKQAMRTIAERNRVVDRIIGALDERGGFLIVGHSNPDEDCIAAMVGFALVAKKFAKGATILLDSEVHENLEYLIRICRYNAIDIVYSLSEDIDYDTIVVCDTAKPELLCECDGLIGIIRDAGTLTIEIDHHLAADSQYHADRKYALVDSATSSSELVGVMAYKLSLREEFLADRQIPEVFTRNIVLAILTGIVGDTQMGKFLQNRKERRMYAAFTGIFGSLLFEKTSRRSSNLASVDQLFSELRKLSRKEEQCFDALYARKRISGDVAYLVLDENDYSKALSEYGNDAVSTVLRTIADSLAEESGCVSIVAYSARPGGESLLQCRARRSKHYKSVDLREMLSRFEIENGGGHQGAVGFRIPLSEIESVQSYVERLVDGLNDIIKEVAAG